MTWETVPVLVTAKIQNHDSTMHSTSSEFTCPMECVFNNASIEVLSNEASTFHEDKDGNLVHTLDWTVSGTYNEWCGGFTGKIDVSHEGNYELMVPISGDSMDTLYRNNDPTAPITIRGTVDIPYKTGDFSFDFVMTRLETKESQVQNAKYLEQGVECIIETYFNHSKISK